MLKDRDQKQKALRLSVSLRWFPQLEVDVQPAKAVSGGANMATDLDVLSSVPDLLRGFRTVIFDCKTRAKESPVNRAFWLSGVMGRTKADHGFCVLKKDNLHYDHSLLASRLNVFLLREDEFDQYANAVSANYANPAGNIGNIDLWDRMYSLPVRFPPLASALSFLRCSYWAAEDAAEACRKTLASLKAVSSELDPAKPEHVALFFDYCALFSRSLAMLVSDIFKLYLQPEKLSTLSEALLIMLYGGREAYEHRNDLYKMVVSKKGDQMPPDLSLPEWDRFLQLTRQLLDAPAEAQRVPLILREVGLSLLSGSRDYSFARTLCSESPQGARFAVLVGDYLAKAAKLPADFSRTADSLLLPLQPTK